MPPATARKEVGSRERILAGGSAEFAAHGFAGARIDRIARRTKLNVRMIYYHFGSKTGLYRGVLESIYEQMGRIVEGRTQAPSDTEDAFGMYFDALVAEPHFAQILVHELLDGAKHLRALWKERPELCERIHTSARHIVEAGAQGGFLRKVDPALTVLTLITMTSFLAATRPSHSLFLDGRTPSAADLKAHLTDLILNGLQA
jgi:TetR/AcrR family transcriptional regulator